jgi:hypothetical protein
MTTIAAGSPSPITALAPAIPVASATQATNWLEPDAPFSTTWASSSFDPRTLDSVLGFYGSLDAEQQADVLGVLSNDADLSASLSNAALTVEDKIMLLLEAVMKKLDQEIEAQGNYVQGLNGGTGGAVRRGSIDGSSPSVDVETSRLKRLIDKRGQIFDMLRQIADKYAGTAKNVTDAMAR